ncbi:hypothetical protein [Pseudomonas sp. PWP3-1]|uniref:hypothetical protein n=1 Tax=unclassified Pseudomonas TaxID=196821 RepID=UPI003CF8639E
MHASEFLAYPSEGCGTAVSLQTQVTEQWRPVQDDFMTIRQAMAVPVAHAAAAAFVRSFVERQKENGGVKRGLLASGQSVELQAT